MSQPLVGRGQRGQTIVVFVLGLAALFAMVGLIVDGGNAYAQHRATQNAADAASEAGATVIARALLQGLTPIDIDVKHAINEIAADNRVNPFHPFTTDSSEAYYTDIAGNMLTAGGGTTTNPANAVRVGSGSIAPCGAAGSCINGHAVGVRALAVRLFGTYVSGVIGLTSFSARTDATAVAGYIDLPCDATGGCPLLPLTFAVEKTTCDGSGDAEYTGDPWLPTEPTGPPFTASNEVLLSLCKKGEGAFGWLDFGCGNTRQQIKEPCNGPVYFPTWLEGQPGNPNGVEDALNKYAGDVVGTYEPGLDLEVLIPFFDGMCNEDRPGSEPPNPPDDQTPAPGSPKPFPGLCPGNPSGGGSNRHYHVPLFIGFILDRAYVQGSDFGPCNHAPGGPPSGPFPGGNGSGGCLKGWFAHVVLPPGPVSADPGPGGPNTPLAIQLIK